MSSATVLHTNAAETENKVPTETFIKSIHIKKLRDIEDFLIELDESERKHLIITGGNGSGKTSLLAAINQRLGVLLNPNNRHRQTAVKNSSRGGVDVEITTPDKTWYFVLRSFFSAKRDAKITTPKGISKIEYNQHIDVGTYFLQYIVNLKAERSFARDDEDDETVEKIDEWFARFEQRLRELFEEPSLELVFNRKSYDFSLHVDGKQSFGFSTLSDGYSAVIAILANLIMKMEKLKREAYDQQGIVLIDEIETHLHVDLQKKILPFLCDFFPKIQFIVATHSLFVISSVENAVVCDLEKRIVTNDLSGYSYDTLIESYFDSDKYSDVVKKKLVDYERLALKSDRSGDEEDLYQDLKIYFDALPKYYAPELHVKPNSNS